MIKNGNKYLVKKFQLGGIRLKSKFFKIGVFVLSFMLVIFGIGSFYVKASNNEVTVKTLSLKESVKSISFDLKYPEVKISNDHVQNKVNASLKQGIYDFKKYLEDVYNEATSMYSDKIVKTSSSFNYEGSSNFEYEVVNGFLSVRMMFTQFTGGAHPMTYMKSYNFDLKSGDSLNIEEIFNEDGKKVYKDIIDKEIKDKINNNPDIYFADEFKGVNENTQYYLTKDGVVVFFQLYELAPYSAGIPEFKISYDLLKDKLSI